jgi:hypothetical protein
MVTEMSDYKISNEGAVFSNTTIGNTLTINSTQLIRAQTGMLYSSVCCDTTHSDNWYVSVLSGDNRRKLYLYKIDKLNFQLSPSVEVFSSSTYPILCYRILKSINNKIIFLLQWYNGLYICTYDCDLNTVSNTQVFYNTGSASEGIYELQSIFYGDDENVIYVMISYALNSTGRDYNKIFEINMTDVDNITVVPCCNLPILGDSYNDMKIIDNNINHPLWVICDRKETIFDGGTYFTYRFYFTLFSIRRVSNEFEVYTVLETPIDVNTYVQVTGSHRLLDVLSKNDDKCLLISYIGPIYFTVVYNKTENTLEYVSQVYFSSNINRYPQDHIRIIDDHTVVSYIDGFYYLFNYDNSSFDLISYFNAGSGTTSDRTYYMPEYNGWDIIDRNDLGTTWIDVFESSVGIYRWNISDQTISELYLLNLSEEPYSASKLMSINVLEDTNKIKRWIITSASSSDQELPSFIVSIDRSDSSKLEVANIKVDKIDTNDLIVNGYKLEIDPDTGVVTGVKQ